MDLFQILAVPARQRILQLLWDNEMAAGEITANFQITFGAVSQHLSILRAAQLVELRKEGKTHYYRARKQTLGPIATYLEQTWKGDLLRLKALAEFEEQQSCPNRRKNKRKQLN
jgi:DNA-binding transcriptional ArsR family regulator